MTSYEKIWDIAEENHGVISSAQALRVGVPAAALVSMATNHKLVHLGYGVYKLEFHAPGQYDEYAQAVAMVGETGFIRGASSLMMRKLIPFDPSRLFLGVTKRVRRHLPEGYDVKRVQSPSLEHIEGIPVQKVAEALDDARACGAIDTDVIKQLEHTL